jgi:hypothetical protein
VHPTGPQGIQGQLFAQDFGCGSTSASAEGGAVNGRGVPTHEGFGPAARGGTGGKVQTFVEGIVEQTAVTDGALAPAGDLI